VSSGDQLEKAVSAIYEASISPDAWDRALAAIAEAMGASQSAMMILEDGRLTRGCMPLMDPEHLRTYAEIQAEYSSVTFDTPATSVALGRVVGIDDPNDRNIFENSFEYREWWREHDLGIGAIFANLVFSGSHIAQIGVYRSRKSGFAARDRRKLSRICDHLIRAARISKRIEIHTSAPAHSTGDQTWILVVDRDYRLLGNEPCNLKDLHSYGVVAHGRLSDCSIVLDPRLRNLVDEAQPPSNKAGSCSFSNDDGDWAWVDVMPVSEGETRYANWLNLDRPAALLQFTIPRKRAALRILSLARDFCLTPAEKSVAIEIVKGDGRAAVARRLGISESTVRSHLSVIFEKIGIHRQSELIELVAR